MFSTNPSLNQFIYDNNGKQYYGTYISYFKRKSLGIKDSFSTSVTFNIYPNPTTDILNIQSKENLPENTSLRIYDVVGKQVFSKLAENSNMNQINLSHLNSGIYILQIKGNDIDQTFKFIKN